jgi:hypothetical protein
VNDPDRQPALPGLRSAGLLLLRPARKDDLEARAASASRRTAVEEDQHLTADELTLGYRVDVRGGDSTWRSLCHRRVAYRVREQDSDNQLVLGGSPRVFEEGHVKPFAAARGDDGKLHADQVVLRWDGWSLVLPRMDPLEDRPPPLRPPALPLPYHFSWDCLRPGEQFGQADVPDDRLPPLRFAALYQLRVRIADVTGGGPGPQDVEDNQPATQEILYTRHDPVRPPLLGGAGDSFTPGAAIDRLVLRSDKGLTAEQFAAAEPRYASMERRTLLRPSVSFELTEQHRMFDRPDDEQTLRWAQLAIQDFSAGLPDPAAHGVNAYVAAAPGGLSESISDHSPWADWPDPTPKFLQLTEETDERGTPVALHWSGNTLVVGLRKGEQAVLELSSRITPGGMQAHFAWNDWLSHDPGLAASIAGRNPAITPPRRVEIVHAVRRPATDPIWQLPSPLAARAEHATTAVLTPKFTSLDTDATGRIEVWATWQEWTDSGHEDVTPQLVHAQTIDRGDPPTPTVRQEFGDTKHRTIHYTIKAVSRYRPYFFADEPEHAFEVVRPQDGPVYLLSSARPGPLSLRGTAPSFHWQANASPTRIERIRTPRIRVEVARPWYQTGEGESLGVIVATRQPPPAAIMSSLTEIGRDPIAASPAPPRFPSASWLTAAAGAAGRLTPEGFVEAVDVVPHGVTRADDHWYADVAMDVPTESYMPFVKLALARYQPDSLPPLRLSPIVTTDLVPLLPQRRLVVERRDAAVAVTLTGPGPNPPNRFEVTLETCSADAPADLGQGGLVVLDSPGGGVPGWRPAVGPPASVAVGATAVLALPAPGARARLRVHEVEAIEGPVVPGRPELGRRAVYFDVVELPAAWLAP